MTLGDAFTSAEGVDTQESWPRILEDLLRRRLDDNRVEVLNFAITGYGPNQNAAVFQEFGPLYRPDLVLIGFFVNEFFDALLPNGSFQSEIGFGLPAQNGVGSYLEAAQARKLLQHRVTDPLRELLTGTPRSYGYFLGNFRAFDTEALEELLQGAEVVEDEARRNQGHGGVDRCGGHRGFDSCVGPDLQSGGSLLFPTSG